MFEHYKYIPPQHCVALQSAIRNHSVTSGVNSQLLARMYKLALEGLTENVSDSAFFTSTLKGGAITMSSVTEGKTGLWLQLAHTAQQKREVFLTIGQKWIMEMPVPSHGNISTVIW